MKILLVRISSLGDIINTIYAINDLYINRKDIELHWLCEESFKDILYLHPFIKRVHIVNIRKLKKNIFNLNNWHNLINLYKNLKEEKYDLVIDIQGLIKSAILSKFTSSIVYGLDKKIIREKLACFFYKKTFYVEDKNIILKNRKILANIFNYKINENKEKIDLLIKDFYLENFDFTPNSFNILVVNTSSDKKLWEKEKWIKLIHKIYLKDKKNIYLIYASKEEYKRCLSIANNLIFVKIIPKISIREISSIIKNAKSIISLDTGILHLANLLDKKTIGIYIKTNPEILNITNNKYQLYTEGKGKNPSVDEVYKKWKIINNYN